MRSVAVDYGRYGIRCNAVAAGATETPLMWVNVPPADVEPVCLQVRSEVPLGRLAEPIDIARAIVWLVSPDAAYVTGATLLVDGGAAARLILSA